MDAQHRLDYEAALREWTHARTLFAFDFDGTLAPLVDSPEKACAPATVWRALRALQRHAHVAVISGRSRSSLVPRLPELSYLVGNHGNEGLPMLARQTEIHLSEVEPICTRWAEQLQVGFQRDGTLQGAFIEHKGYTLAVHYRHCPNRSRAHAELMARIARLAPSARIIEGVFVVNLLPPGMRTKREALQVLQQHSGCHRALFVGDDLTDELVFENAPPLWLCLRVGPCDTTHAHFVLDGTEDVAQLLAQLVKLLSLKEAADER